MNSVVQRYVESKNPWFAKLRRGDEVIDGLNAVEHFDLLEMCIRKGWPITPRRAAAMEAHGLHVPPHLRLT